MSRSSSPPAELRTPLAGVTPTLSVLPPLESALLSSMNRPRELAEQLRRLGRSALLPILLLLSASCSNQMPVTPLPLVQVSGSIRERDGAGVAGAYVHAS